jgi:hypothetical protein
MCLRSEVPHLGKPNCTFFQVADSTRLLSVSSSTTVVLQSVTPQRAQGRFDSVSLLNCSALAWHARGRHLTTFSKGPTPDCCHPKQQWGTDNISGT